MSKDDKTIIKFPMMGEAPWCKMPMDLIRHTEVNLSFLKVFACIDYYAGKRGYWYDYQKHLAGASGVSLAQAKRALKWLKDNKFIDMRFRGTHYNRQYIYTIPSRCVVTPDFDDLDSSPVSQDNTPHELTLAHTRANVSSPVSQRGITGELTYNKEYHRPLPQTSNLSLAKHPANKQEPKAAKPQERDLQFEIDKFTDTQREIWGELEAKFSAPKTRRETQGRIWCVQQLAEAGGSGREIRHAYRQWYELHPKGTCTPHALVEHWGRLLDKRSGYTKMNASAPVIETPIPTIEIPLPDLPARTYGLSDEQLELAKRWEASHAKRKAAREYKQPAIPVRHVLDKRGDVQ